MHAASGYIGRFAPSPTGPLHFGSLVAALGSYLDARHHGGQWLLRIEDLDPPREIAGAADQIIASLRLHGLHWDGPVTWQSQRLNAYSKALQELVDADWCFYCECSRSQLVGHPIYPGRCRKLQLAAAGRACRIIVGKAYSEFTDHVLGHQGQHLDREPGDFVLLRRDGLYAYQLAVVVDDAAQGITHIVRGADLLDSTPRQLYLQQRLQLPQPQYAHLPVATNAQGQKLSKQNLAPALDGAMATDNLRAALAFLGQAPPPDGLRQPEQLLEWATRRWQMNAIPAKPAIEWPG